MYVIIGIYDSLSSAKSRKVTLNQICRCLQMLNQCPTSATLDKIYSDYTPEDMEGIGPGKLFELGVTEEKYALINFINDKSTEFESWYSK